MSPIAKRRTLIVVAVMATTIALQQIGDYHARRTAVTCGEDIKFAGEYFLEDDCISNGDYSIKISQNDVNLDLNDHQITCAQQSQTGFGIQMTNQKNIHIRDGAIHDCTFAIIGGGGKNVNVNNITFYNIKTIAVLLKGQNNYITNNHFKNFKNGSFGIHSPGDNATIQNNKFKNFSEKAITLLK